MKEKEGREEEPEENEEEEEEGLFKADAVGEGGFIDKQRMNVGRYAQHAVV